MAGPRDTIRNRMRQYNRVIREIGAALYEFADDVRAEAHRSISAGSVSGKKHKPSAPNTPPNRDTGHLQSNLRVADLGMQANGEIVSQVKSDAPYSAALEFGTSKMAARPFLRPARNKIAPRAERRLIARINKITRGNSK